jgi:ATP-dependent Clp protease ATP-binding subunit ClpB
LVVILLHSFEVIVTREHEFSDALSNRMSFRGFAALHYAVLIDDVHVVKALLEAGADPTIKTNAGYLPVDFAQHSPVMKDLLVKASTEVGTSLHILHVCCTIYIFCRIL